MKPILFNTEMVRAIMEGRKSVTRRVVKPRYSDSVFEICQGQLCEASPYIPPRKNGDGTTTHTVRRYLACKQPYHHGDILYVRETWTKLWYVDANGYAHFDKPMYYYAADGNPDITFVDADGYHADDQRIRWHPSIHMPKEAARLFLRVTDVRVERLHDITPEQARAEGVIPNMWDSANESYGYVKSKYVRAFEGIWKTTIKPADLPLYGWDVNPWVWVIEFERISKEDAIRKG